MALARSSQCQGELRPGFRIGTVYLMKASASACSNPSQAIQRLPRSRLRGFIKGKISGLCPAALENIHEVRRGIGPFALTPIHRLHVKRSLRGSVEGSLLDGLRVGRVAVANAGNVFGRSAELHGYRKLHNEVCGACTHNVGTQYLVG